MGVWMRRDVVGFHSGGEGHEGVVDRVDRYLGRVRGVGEGGGKEGRTYFDGPAVLLGGV